MWPQSFPAWFDEFAPEALRHVAGRIAQYPALQVFRNRIASLGVARAREIGEYLRQYDDYFAHKYEFGRWLRLVSYREALRLLLSLEPVELALRQMAPEVRRLLRWLYVEHFAGDEVARMLDLRAPNRALFDVPAGRAQARAAYVALCEVIEKRSRTGEVPKAGPHRDVTAVFPLFVGLTREDIIPSTARGPG